MRLMGAHMVNNDTVRVVERETIRDFVQSQSEHFTGVVLDYGCGKQPYRDIIERAGAEYIGYDRVRFPANISGEDLGELGADQKFDAILCTQVAQYWPSPTNILSLLRKLLQDDGVLVMTFPTTWAEVERADLWRYTEAGMDYLLMQAGFDNRVFEQRAAIDLSGFRLPIGYGVVAHS